MPRKSIPILLFFAAGAMVFVAMQTWRRDATDRSLEGSSRPEMGAAGNEVFRRKSPPIGNIQDLETRERLDRNERDDPNAAVGAKLLCSVRVLHGQNLDPTARVDVEARFLCSLAAMDIQAVGWRDDRAAFVAESSCQIMSGCEGRLEVGLAGLYALRARVSPDSAWTTWQQSTAEGAHSLTFLRVDGLHLRIEDVGGFSVTRVSLSGTSDAGGADRNGVSVGDHEWEFRGDSFVLPAVIGVWCSDLPSPIWLAARDQEQRASFKGLVAGRIDVVDAETDEPITNATIEIELESGRYTTTTDSRGTASIPCPTSDADGLISFGIRAHAVGHASCTVLNWRSLPVRESGAYELRMLRSGCPGGSILRSDGSAPVGTRVFLATGISVVAGGVVDASGGFVLKAGGTAGNSGTATDPASVGFVNGVAGCILLVRGPEGCFGVIHPVDWAELSLGRFMARLEEARDWNVQVIGGADEAGVAEALIHRVPVAAARPLRWLETEFPAIRTDDGGVASLGRIYGGSWEVRVSADGFAPYVHISSPVSGIADRIELASAKTLNLTIVDSKLVPISGARVELRSNDGQVLSSRTGEDGCARLSVDAGAEYSYAIDAGGLRPDLGAPSRLHGRSEDVTIRMVRPVEVRFDLHGAADGEQVELAVIRYRSVANPLAAHSSIRSAFSPTLKLASAETTEFQVIAPGFLPSNWEPIDLATSESLMAISISLQPGPRLSGRLKSHESVGTDLGRATLKPLLLDGLPVKFEGDDFIGRRFFAKEVDVQAGDFEFSQVTPGIYLLRLVQGGREVVEKRLEIRGDTNIGAVGD